MKIHFAISGQYRLVLNEGTDREVDTGWFDNLVTDIGLDRLATGLTCSRYGSIGTGNTTPANGNTTLVAFSAEKDGGVSDGSSNLGASTYVSTTQHHWVYAQGAVVGNMAEVGVGWGASGTNLFSRALILDGGGSPTTLTVTLIDQLTVYYKVTITPQLTDLSGTVTLDSIVYNTVGRIANAASWNSNFSSVFTASGGLTWPKANGGSSFAMVSYSTQTLGAITSNPSGAGSSGCSNGTVTVGSYTPGQKYLDSTITAIPAECNSSGGVGAIMFSFCSSQMQYQYSFAAASGGAVIPKDNTKTLQFVLRLSWDRL